MNQENEYVNIVAAIDCELAQLEAIERQIKTVKNNLCEFLNKLEDAQRKKIAALHITNSKRAEQEKK